MSTASTLTLDESTKAMETVSKTLTKHMTILAQGGINAAEAMKLLVDVSAIPVGCIAMHLSHIKGNPDFEKSLTRETVMFSALLAAHSTLAANYADDDSTPPDTFNGQEGYDVVNRAHEDYKLLMGKPFILSRAN